MTMLESRGDSNASKKRLTAAYLSEKKNIKTEVLDATESHWNQPAEQIERLRLRIA